MGDDQFGKMLKEGGRVEASANQIPFDPLLNQLGVDPAFRYKMPRY